MGSEMCIRDSDHTTHGGIQLGDVISLSYPSSTGENTTHIVTVTAVNTPWAAPSTIVNITVNQTGDNMAISAAGDGSGYIIARVQDPQPRTCSFGRKINVYSFALRPEEHQPSGTCNFSRIDNAVLQLVLSSGTVSGTATAKVRVYAVNYNVLRVMSGMAGVAYSN